MAGYLAPVLAIVYGMGGEQFLWFWKNIPLAISFHFFPFWLKQIFGFFLDVLSNREYYS